MKAWDGLSVAILALLSNKATLILAQYVTTVTVSINNNDFCPLETGLVASSGSTGGASVASSASGPATTGGEAGGPVSASELHMNGSISSTSSARENSGTTSTSSPATTVGEAGGPMKGSASSTGSATSSR